MILFVVLRDPALGLHEDLSPAILHLVFGEDSCP